VLHFKTDFGLAYSKRRIKRAIHTQTNTDEQEFEEKKPMISRRFSFFDREEWNLWPMTDDR
jgi:hypothetical protein